MTAKLLETFLEAILWKPFQLFCRTKTVLSMLISVEGTGKDQLPVIMSSRNLLSFSDRRMMSPEMLIRVSFCSGVSLPGTKWWQKRRMFNTSWRILWQLPTEISNLLCNLVHRFPTVTSHNLVHAGHLLHLLTLMGDHYADHRQWSRVHHGTFMPVIHLKLFYCSVTIRLLQHDW